ncbi:MAG: hypothetical protein WBQ60_08400, partial [Asticcacaulis sp.]
GMRRSSSLQTKKPLQTKSGFANKPASAIDQIKAQKKALQTATLRALEKAKRAANEQGIALSEWETDFIDDLGERIKTYGRAFADPDKGAMNGTLSLRQGLKLKEIRKKVQTKAQNRPKPDKDS